MPPFVVYAAAAMLALGAAPLPYGYYVLLRIVATLIFVWAAVVAHERRREALPWIFALLALLFNPVVKVPLGKPLWAMTDIAAAILLLACVPVLTRKPVE